MEAATKTLNSPNASLIPARFPGRSKKLDAKRCLRAEALLLHGAGTWPRGRAGCGAPQKRCGARVRRRSGPEREPSGGGDTKVGRWVREASGTWQVKGSFPSPSPAAPRSGAVPFRSWQRAGRAGPGGTTGPDPAAGRGAIYCERPFIRKTFATPCNWLEHNEFVLQSRRSHLYFP